MWVEQGSEHCICVSEPKLKRVDTRANIFGLLQAVAAVAAAAIKFSARPDEQDQKALQQQKCPKIV